MTTTEDIRSCITAAERRLSTLTRRIDADSHAYLDEIIQKGARACFDALTVENSLLTPKDRATLRRRVDAELRRRQASRLHRWREQLTEFRTLKGLRRAIDDVCDLILRFVFRVLKLAIPTALVLAPVLFLLFAAWQHTASFHAPIPARQIQSW